MFVKNVDIIRFALGFQECPEWIQTELSEIVGSINYLNDTVLFAMNLEGIKDINMGSIVDYSKNRFGITPKHLEAMLYTGKAVSINMKVFFNWCDLQGDKRGYLRFIQLLEKCDFINFR